MSAVTEKELRRRMADAALAWLGRKEADGSFREILAVYNAIRPLPRGYAMKDRDPWCAAFVSAVGAKAGLTEIVFPECSCPRMMALYKAAGRWEEVDFAAPKPGDVVFYDWDGDRVPDHVGLVTAAEGDYVTVAEGNKSDAVGKRKLHLDNRYILGYGQPDYFHYADKTGSEPSASGSDPERKKEGADAELSAEAGSKAERASSDEGYGQPDYFHYADKTGLPPAGELRPPAAGGGEREAGIPAAVEKPEHSESANGFSGTARWTAGERSETDEGEGSVSQAPSSVSSADIFPPQGGRTALALPLLSSGSRGEAVRAAQLLLIGRGFGCGRAGADGDFGPDTRGGTLRFQRSRGLAADGEIGPETWAALLGVAA